MFTPFNDLKKNNNKKKKNNGIVSLFPILKMATNYAEIGRVGFSTCSFVKSF